MPPPPSFPTKPLTRISVSQSPVHAVTFSSGTGQYILTGSQDRQIRLFNPNSSQKQINSPIQTFSAHGHEILDLSVSPDNSRLASVGGDKLVFLWDVSTATTIRRFAGHAGRINAVSFAGGGSGEDSSSSSVLLASGSFDGTVKFWDLRARSNEKAIMSLGEAKDSVSAVEVRNGEVFVGSVDGRVRIYDLANGKCETDVIAPGKGVTSVSVTREGDAYLASSLDSRLRLMDRRSGRCLQGFGDEEGYVNGEYRIRSCLASGDACAVSGSENGRVVVWDVLTGKVMHRVWHKEGGGDGSPASKRDVVCAVAWNQLRKQFASAGGDGSVVVWGMDERG